MAPFTLGERVAVEDPGHIALLNFLRVANRREPDPIHHGVVAEILEDGDIVVLFDDDGSRAPYPASQLQRLQ